MKKKNANGAVLGFDEKLWQAADKLRGHMESRGVQALRERARIVMAAINLAAHEATG